MRRALVLFPVLGLVLAAGCQKQSRVEIDEARLGTEVDRRAAQAVERPGVNAELDRLFAVIAADPKVARAAEGLVSALAADPTIAAGFGAVVQRIGEDPGLQAMIMKLLADNPGMSAERVGAIMEARVGAVVDGKDFDAAFDSAFARLLAHPRIEGALRRFGEAVASSDSMSQALREIIDSRSLEREFAGRLTKLNGGRRPGRARATDLLLEHVFTVDRLARFYEKLFAMPLLRKELTGTVGELLASDAFRDLAKKRLRPLLANRELQGRMVKLVMLLVEDAPSRERLEAAIADLLAVPVVAEQLGGFLDELVTSPAFKDLGTSTLARITGDPAFRDLVSSTLFEGW